MEFIYGLSNLRKKRKDCVATIGNFDGVHLGHQTILKQLRDASKNNNLISTVLLFEPQPMEYFRIDVAPSRLASLREKVHQFIRFNIERVVCLKFDDKLANLSASEFVDDILLDGLSAKKIIVGDDFHFAKNREGNYQYLSKLSKERGFETFRTNTYEEDGVRISSTLIRNLLAKGDIEAANRYLGRYFIISGRVIHGDNRGKKLGFPTVNIKLDRYLAPVTGIFSGRIRGVDNKILDTVIYVGSKPIYNGEQTILEAHILDFDGDLYGCFLEVEFHVKLREDDHISNENEMLKQIKIDIEQTRQYFQKMKIINH